jgi:hypothetical protein
MTLINALFIFVNVYRFYRYLAPYKQHIKQYGMEFWATNSNAKDKSMNNGDSIMSSCKLKFATVEALQ